MFYIHCFFIYNSRPAKNYRFNGAKKNLTILEQMQMDMPAGEAHGIKGFNAYQLYNYWRKRPNVDLCKQFFNYSYLRVRCETIPEMKKPRGCGAIIFQI